MPSSKLKPTKLESISASIYAGGTAILYTETIHNLLLLPLFSSLISHVAPDMPETNKNTISTCASYLILLPFFVILSRTQYSSNCRAIEAYNQQIQTGSEEALLLHPGEKPHETRDIIPKMSAACKSTATGISAWSLFSKIPVVGRFVGVAAGIITFSGSFFTQRKFLGLKIKKPHITTGSEAVINSSDYGAAKYSASVLP